MKLFYLVKKELIEITRQKELLFLMFVSPVIQIIILGYVISTDIRHVPVGIVNLSRGQAAAQHHRARPPLAAVRRAPREQPQRGLSLPAQKGRGQGHAGLPRRPGPQAQPC